MKKLLLTLCIILTVTISFSQTVFWTEDFGIGCSQGQSANGFAGSTGNWVVNFLTPPFPGGDNFYVSATETGRPPGACSSDCISNPFALNSTLHVSPSASSTFFACTTGDCGAIYNSGIPSDLRAESPPINCVGKSGISLKFDYLENGDATLDDGEVYYSVALGPWTLLSNPAKTFCGNTACTATAVCSGLNAPMWASHTVNLPAVVNNVANLRIGFRWKNNGDFVGIDPSYAIDSIAVSAATITAVEQIIVNDDIYKIYPNPAKDVIYMETEAKEFNSVKVEITDVLGRVIISDDKKFNAGQNVQPIIIRELNGGIYFVRIISDGKSSQSIKIIKE